MHKRNAFTLIELLVVIAILAILIAILIMRYGMGQPLAFLGKLAAFLLFEGVGS